VPKALFVSESKPVAIEATFRTNWHVATAAEAIAAAQFARLGFDVAIQYGANQPQYDLMVASDTQMLKMSVKGSSDGAWGLLGP
jgi:hypothetical protein